MSDKINYQFALRRWGAKHVGKEIKKVLDEETKKSLMSGGQTRMWASCAGVTLASHFKSYTCVQINTTRLEEDMMRF